MTNVTDNKLKLLVKMISKYNDNSYSTNWWITYKTTGIFKLEQLWTSNSILNKTWIVR